MFSRDVTQRGTHALSPLHVRLVDSPEADVLADERAARRLQRVRREVVDRLEADPVAPPGRILQLVVGQVTREIVLREIGNED